jgi:hypothetical protein
VLETVRIVNDVARLVSVTARAGECPEAVLEGRLVRRVAGREGSPLRGALVEARVARRVLPPGSRGTFGRTPGGLRLHAES